MAIEVRVPNLGDFSDVEVIEVAVVVGDNLALEDPVVTLETDKASMEIPATAAGRVESMSVKVGDKVSEGDLLLTLDPVESGSQVVADDAMKQPANEIPTSGDSISTEVVVLGSGPGGYTAAFRAADLGKEVVLVERYTSLGGVCLNVGCIPSKALLHAAKVISEAKEVKQFGIEFGEPKIDLDKLRGWKEKVLGQLTNGLKGLAKQRKVQVVQGEGKFVSPNQLSVSTAEGEKIINFEQAIIAAGSQATKVPIFPDDPRIIDSTGALELKEIPKRMLVIGGGIIGLEMATVYHELGTKITVVEMLDNIVVGADADVVKPLLRRIQKQYENIFLGTRVTEIKVQKNGLEVSFDGPKAPDKDSFDAILVAVGRRPNGHNIGADSAGVNVDEQGFIPVDKQQRTNVPHIHAIGDIVGQPMLAHKAVHEGKVAAEVIAGMKSAFDARVIPSVAYTDPEVAWVGMTETEAKEQGINYGKGVFPWAASGRSLSLGRNEGVTKLLFDEDTEHVLGAGICGPNAGDLIAEVALAIEMGCDATDLSLTIHPHPTLSETVAFAAEMFEGTITDLYAPKKK
jgi:dihydrolipoyl dehydrogenase